MKQVRFDTPRRSDTRLYSCRAEIYESADCQEPRQLVGPRVLPAAMPSQHSVEYQPIPFYSPLQQDHSGPVPVASKTVLPLMEKRLSQPSLDLELSRYDETSLTGNLRRHSADSRVLMPLENFDQSNEVQNDHPKAIKQVEYGGLPSTMSSTLHIDSNFKKTAILETNNNVKMFLPHEPIETFSIPNWVTSKLAFNENPLKTRVDMPNISNFPNKNDFIKDVSKHCNCHHGIPSCNKENFCQHPTNLQTQHKIHFGMTPHFNQSPREQEDILEPSLYSPWNNKLPRSHQQPVQSLSHCSCRLNQATHNISRQLSQCQNILKPCCPHPSTGLPVFNSIEAKKAAIEKHEQRNETSDSCAELEKQTNVSNGRREPTVSDLFKIIKIQNEQLKLLQERVDKLLTSQPKLMDTSTPFRPVQNYVKERVSVETVDENHHKISIGVMTSFEVRTNRDRIKSVSQMQCNKSQVSMKGDASTGECNLNFLDGIAPVDQNFVHEDRNTNNNNPIAQELMHRTQVHRQSLDNENTEKTLNELSLCNLQLDNATTPQLSPDQTIYLDVKDYSDSENDDESGVGWTYYNKVMSHVNEILQESAVPSSAGALHRRAVAAAAEAGAAPTLGGGPGGGGARCTRLHVDRTDVSITTSKRVTFGEQSSPIDYQKHFAHPVSSDTSIHMNRLAAKYLKNKSTKNVPRPMAVSSNSPLDMSLATRRYMEKHHLLQDAAATATPSRILDITALKQQPKLL